VDRIVMLLIIIIIKTIPDTIVPLTRAMLLNSNGNIKGYQEHCHLFLFYHLDYYLLEYFFTQ